MRAWVIDDFTGVEKIRLTEVQDPKCGPGEVLLRIRFAALNPADAYLARALYPAKPPLPHILGRDGVGDVLEVGSGVDNIRPGQTLGILRCDVGVKVWGTLAEKTVAPAVSLASVPEGWTLEQMAGAPLTFLTAWQALTQWSDPPAPPPRDSVLLVTGASGGVGVASVLLGKSLGLKVVALSRSAEKGATLRELGADHVFAPDDPNLVRGVKSAAGAVDLVVDNVGGALFNSVVATLGYRGRISVVGRSGGPVAEFNTGTLFFKRNRIGGVSVGDYSSEQAQQAWREILAHLPGKRPVVDRVFPFDQVPAAFSRLAEGPMGKVLVSVG
jgi:NADPH2:quinone reductase